MNKVLFTTWTGTNRMSPQRRVAFESLRKTSGVENVHITRTSLSRWVDPTLPLHPQFDCLSPTHQSDYLRCYLLHVHGGGYSDIKHASKTWRPCFDAIDDSDCLGGGYTEIGPHGVAPVGGALERKLRASYLELIGCSAILFRARSVFTAKWFHQLTGLMDSKAAELRRHPARHPADRCGARFTNGEASRYPMKWSAVMGDIFHPLAFAYRSRILHLDMAPSFVNYK